MIFTWLPEYTDCQFSSGSKARFLLTFFTRSNIWNYVPCAIGFTINLKDFVPSTRIRSMFQRIRSEYFPGVLSDCLFRSSLWERIIFQLLRNMVQVIRNKNQIIRNIIQIFMNKIQISGIRWRNKIQLWDKRSTTIPNDATKVKYMIKQFDNSMKYYEQTWECINKKILQIKVRRNVPPNFYCIFNLLS